MSFTERDWRGILAFTFTIGFFIVLIVELIYIHSSDLTASKTILPPLMLILGFYFGEKSTRRRGTQK